ncbi:MAG: phosphodiester glycosidase family protein [bacterium]|nr:phosphodiester glycosidase family protein [bacterium]
MNKHKLSILITAFAIMLPITTNASLFDNVRGKIVLQVEQNGEAWYVDPSIDRRYYLGRPDDAFDIMRERSLGITNADLARIPQDGEPWNANADFMSRIQGKILLQVEENGEAWYVYPVNGRRYYLGRPDDAFDIMRNLGLGITDADLGNIAIANSLTDTAGSTEYSNYTVNTERGGFAIHLVTMPRSSTTFITDTGNESDCGNNCSAKSLNDYVAEHNGIAGIHGTYFCPPDYASCSGQTYSFLPPVFNTNANVMINESKLPFHSGPLLVVTTDGEYHYFHRSYDFGYTVADWEAKNGKQVQAAIANYPSLIENGEIVVHSESVDSKQQTKGARGGIGYNDDSIFLVLASSASVDDMAYIFKALNASYAMNLDGGGSTALYAEGGYKVGPGRLLPNAIVFK